MRPRYTERRRNTSHRNEKSVRSGRGVAALATLLALGALAASDAWAGGYSAARKAGRGLAGMTTGFLEVPGNIVVETRRNGPASGMTLGFVKGLGGIVVRERVGVYEFVSAPFPVPAGYRPVLTSEYPWSYFDASRELADAGDPSSTQVASGAE